MKNEFDILIVDDNPKNLQVLGNILRHYNYKVEFALDGQNAIKWANRKKFDLILLDIMMPGMSGFDVCKTIKNSNGSSDIPIIFITAKTDVESIVKGFKCGAIDYISKPFNAEELNARIATQVSLRNRQNKIQKYSNTLKEQLLVINESLDYAKKIQRVMLPVNDDLKRLLPKHFIIHLPRDIVSGDFYWMKEFKDSLFIGVGDCTGHGIPGAMLSMLCISLLNEIVLSDNIRPSDILECLRTKLKNNLHQMSGNDKEFKDGLDIALCKYNLKTKLLEYSGAFRPLIVIKNSELIEIKGNRQPVGIFEYETEFTHHSVQLQKKDLIYLFTDGFNDQFGGKYCKKLKYGNFKRLLADYSKFNINEQNILLKDHFYNWKGNEQQTDDVLVIGIEID